MQNTGQLRQAANGRASSSEALPLRRAPHNIEAEQALLGATLVSNEALERVSDFLKSEHFFDPLHRQIYEAASSLISSGRRADPFTLKTFFEHAEPIDAGMTVPQYLGRLAANAATIINARDYGRTIHDLATRRQMIIIGEDMVNAAFDSPVDFPPDEQIAEGVQRFESLRDARGSLAVKVTRASTFAGRSAAPRTWHVRDLIPGSDVTMLMGDGATGKSLLALQLAVATVLGRTWLGQDVRRGKVVYIGAEDDLDEMHRRLATIAKHIDIELDRLEDLHILCRAGEDAVLASSDESNIVRSTPLWGRVGRIVLALRPALVIYDPLADLFAGNENSRPQARQFVGMLRGLALKTHSTALLLGHPSVAGMASGSGTSGSTAWSNSVRSRLYLERIREDGEEDADARALRTMKANYGPAGGEIRVRWQAGAFVTDNIAPGAHPARSAKQLQVEDLFLKLLSEYEGQGRYVSDKPGRNHAPAVLAADPRAARQRVTAKAFRSAMARLFTDQRIRMVERNGPPSKQGRSKLEIIP